MPARQEQAQSVFWFIETKSDVQTQQNYKTKYGKDPPSRPSICLWPKKFMDTETVFDAERSGQPRSSEENIKHVRQAFHRSIMKSIHTSARQLELPGSTVHKVQSENDEKHVLHARCFFRKFLVALHLTLSLSPQISCAIKEMKNVTFCLKR